MAPHRSSRLHIFSGRRWSLRERAPFFLCAERTRRQLMGNQASSACSVDWTMTDRSPAQRDDCRVRVSSFMDCQRLELHATENAPSPAPAHTTCTEEGRIPVVSKSDHSYYCCTRPSKHVPDPPLNTIKRSQVFDGHHFHNKKCMVGAPSPHLSKNAPTVEQPSHWLHGRCDQKPEK